MCASFQPGAAIPVILPANKTRGEPPFLGGVATADGRDSVFCWANWRCMASLLYKTLTNAASWVCREEEGGIAV